LRSVTLRATTYCDWSPLSELWALTIIA
jgi:hypothetical protein